VHQFSERRSRERRRDREYSGDDKRGAVHSAKR
jgi:hypothetical protein